MPDPSTLPRELFLQIFYDTIGGKPDRWMYCYHVLPADLCLVNKQWYRALTPLLYSRFEFTGHGEHAKSLWGFFRTIILRPELAGHIRMLGFTMAWTPVRPPKTAALYRKNAKIVRQAIEQAEAELRQADHRSLVALVLAHAPNLAILQLHVLRDDPWLDAILAHAISRTGSSSGGTDAAPRPEAVAFQSLQTLYIASGETPRFYGRNAHQTRHVSYPARMNAQRAFLRLPNLQELQLIDAQLDEDVLVSAAQAEEESALTQLTIAFRSPVENIKPVLRYTSRLTHLSLALSITGRHFAD
ncbi:hypothetical protein BJX76DRAFT_354473 [Aspergillus varians]